MREHRQSTRLSFGPVAEFWADLPTGETLAVLVSSSVRHASGARLQLESLARNRTLVELPPIGPDAPLPSVLKALDHLRSSGAQTLVAIGGGSVIDAAKALSVFALGGDLTDVFFGRAPLPMEKIRLIAVPTTAGSGAELSYGAILFDPDTRTKGGLRSPRLQPDVVIIDPPLYLTATPERLAESGFDALTHAVETYVSSAATPLCHRQSVAAISVLLDQLPLVVERRSVPAMEKVAVAAALMGNNLANSTTCLPHRIQYALRAFTEISHASGLVMLYRGWLESLGTAPDDTPFDALAAELGFDRFGLIDEISRLKSRLNLNHRLRNGGLTAADIPRVVERTSGRLEVDPCYSGPESIRTILERSL